MTLTNSFSPLQVRLLFRIRTSGPLRNLLQGKDWPRGRRAARDRASPHESRYPLVVLLKILRASRFVLGLIWARVSSKSRKDDAPEAFTCVGDVTKTTRLRNVHKLCSDRAKRGRRGRTSWPLQTLPRMQQKPSPRSFWPATLPPRRQR